MQLRPSHKTDWNKLDVDQWVTLIYEQVTHFYIYAPI